MQRRPRRLQLAFTLPPCCRVNVAVPVNPTSSFAVNLTFLDDAVSYDRVEALVVGNASIAPRIALPPKEILVQQWVIGPGAVTILPNGKAGLAFSLNALAGPNAVLSGFVLFSSNPNDPPITPPQQPVPSHALPRLTPRPSLIAGVSDPLTLDLMGTWQFDPAPSAAFLGALGSLGKGPVGANWSAITVPGEYTLQGFRVPTGQPVVYQTTFATPAAWPASLRVKLRCDGAYSNATLYVNGAFVGAHLGGFTPFELDITSALGSSGSSNVLTVIIVGASLADSLASGSQYASHDLGGITRKIYLLAVPALSIADAHVITTFDQAGSPYTDGFLFVVRRLRN